MTPTFATWEPVLAPEEVELVDEYLAPPRPPLGPPASVYTLALSDGSTYIGISNAPARRLAEHRAAARRPLPGSDRAVPVTDPPGEVYLALHGEPEMVAEIRCPSRRHAHLYECLLTDRVAQFGLEVHGAGWDQSAPRWARNGSRGEKMIDPAVLAILASA